MKREEITNDMDRFEALVREITPALYRYAYGMLGSNMDAEDAVQETWLDVYHSKGCIRDWSSIRPYVYRITYRRCADILRQRYRKKEVLPEPDRDPGLSAEMLAALAELSTLDRALVCGRVLEDMSYRELAAVLHRTEGSLRKRYERAIRRLENALGKERSHS